MHTKFLQNRFKGRIWNSHSDTWAWHKKKILELQRQYRGMKKQAWRSRDVAVVAVLQPACASLCWLRWQEQKLASHAAVKSPWFYPSSARILRWLNKVPLVYVTLSLGYCSHNSSCCWLYIQLWWCGSPSHSFLLSPFPSASTNNLHNTRQSADFNHRFQLIIHAVPSSFPSQYFLCLPGTEFPPFSAPWVNALSVSLLSNCCLSPSSPCALPPTVSCHPVVIFDNPLVFFFTVSLCQSDYVRDYLCGWWSSTKQYWNRWHDTEDCLNEYGGKTEESKREGGANI